MTKICYILIYILVAIVSFIFLMKLKNVFLEMHFSNNTTIPNKVIQNVTEYNKVQMKYILLWTSPNNVPFVYIGKGQSGFIQRKCPYTNCIVTANRSSLGDYSKFDVIAFAGPEVFDLDSLPDTRSPHQKYVFASIESSDNYPVCSNRFDRFFNWTWTFKLDSEVRWSYFAIRDKNNTIIGPNKQMQWINLEDMDPVSEKFKTQLKTKTKAAAWFVSNCNTRSKREQLVREIKEELQAYSMAVDVYGNCENLPCSLGIKYDCNSLRYKINIDIDGNEKNLKCSKDNKDIEVNCENLQCSLDNEDKEDNCGNIQCSQDIKDDCNALLEETYYFYFAFENSFSEDYVTEKLLRALNNNVVPIVFGAANYTRFMPDGMYLNAGELTVRELAAKMYELINDLEQYSEYFKWKNHYSYHRQHENVAETEPYCLICAHLNNKEMVNKVTVYDDFRKWWDPPGRCTT